MYQGHFYPKKSLHTEEIVQLNKNGEEKENEKTNKTSMMKKLPQNRVVCNKL